MNLQKQPGESRIYTIDFGQNMARSETVISINSLTVAPSGLTVSAIDDAVYVGHVIQFRLSGGVEGQTYEISASVGTSLGNTLESEVILMVKDRI